MEVDCGDYLVYVDPFDEVMNDFCIVIYLLYVMV